MSDHTDKVAKPSFSERFQRWWFKGMIAAEDPAKLSQAMSSHLQGMAHHALDIQRAAEQAGLRIRRDALASGSRVVGRVEALEAKLSVLEAEFATVLTSVRQELQSMRHDLDQEVAVAEAAPGVATPPVSATYQPANGGTRPLAS